jgi:hypothetical protein
MHVSSQLFLSNVSVLLRQMEERLCASMDRRFDEIERRLDTIAHRIAALEGQRSAPHRSGERAGNVICLPGVTLQSVLRGGDAPGPSAA